MRRTLLPLVAFSLAAFLGVLAEAQLPQSSGKTTPFASSAPAAEAARRLREPTLDRGALDRVAARYAQINETDLRQPPPRELKVQTGEVQKTKLFRADPKLVENKFIAQLNLAPSQITFDSSPYDLRQQSGFPKDIAGRIALDNGSMFSRQSRGSQPSLIFKQLAEYCPADQRPAGQLPILTAPESDRAFNWSSGNRGYAFKIYAPTAEEAKERAAAILRLLDGGISRPLQQYFLTQGREHLALARTKCDEYDALSAEIRLEQEKLDLPSEVSADILSQLKAQRVMVAVELAGLNARVKACDQMLSEPKRLEVSTLGSISDMKVKAEIERIGTQEKLGRINAFIADGERREVIRMNILNLTNRRSDVRRLASSETNYAEAHIRLVEYYAPQDIEGGAIVISPLEWTE